MAEVIIAPEKSETVEDIIDLLGADDADANTSDKDDKEEVKSKSKEDKEEDEDDKEVKDKEEVIEVKDDEDKEDDEEILNVPRKKEILKEFPELFKKFPGMERALYKEAQYAELFPTMQEAKNAKERLTELQEVESSLLNGNIEDVLKSIKETSPQGFDKIVNTYIQTLSKVDPDAYYGVLNFVIDNTLVAAHNYGKNLGGEEGDQLQIAAQLLNKFIKGTQQINAPRLPRKVTDEKNPREEAIQKREQEYNEREMNNAISDVTDRTENTIRHTIDKYIDPKDQMSPYVRNKAMDDVLVAFNESLEQDSRARATINNLWKDAQKNNFDKRSKDRIRNFILNRAKVYLPDDIRRVRADALKNTKATRVIKDEESEETQERIPAKIRTSRESKTTDDKGRRLSTLEILNQD